MSFRRLFSTELSQTATVSSFTTNFGDPSIALPGVISLGALSAEAPQIVKYVRYKIGEPVLTVHLDNRQIFIAFEESNLKYSALINTFQARNWMSNYYGLNKDFTANDLTGKLPQQTWTFIKRMTDSIANEISPAVGGNTPIYKAYVDLTPGKQDYDIYTDVMDKTAGVPLIQSLTASTSGLNSNKIEFKTIYHYPPITLYRFYDPYSSINLLSQEFNFESFNTESIFYVLPVWTDILRAMQLNMSDKVRRSNYSYERVGRRLRFFPSPIRPMRIWIDYQTVTNPFPTDDASVSGISNASNIPLLDIAYDKINPMGRMWIRDYTYATCLEIEGRIRRKFDKIPIPGDSISMDGALMVSEAITMLKDLEEKLREDLDKLSVPNMLKQQAEEQESIEKQYKAMPMFIYMH